MQDRDLDKILQKWSDAETAKAPKMRPTAEMYERVVSLGRRRSLRHLVARRPAWATAAAAVALLLVAFSVVQLSSLLGSQSVPQAAQVALRTAFAGEEGPSRGGPPEKGKGPPQGEGAVRQLVLQVLEAEPSAVRSVDLLTPKLSTVRLTSEASYRLRIELEEARHVYVYQEALNGSLALLFPNQVYSPKRNPTPAGGVIYLPAEPHGFYVEGETGSLWLIIVVAEEPMPELLTLYERYSRPGISLSRSRSLALLGQRLDALTNEETEKARGWRVGLEAR
jgi:hypothetical protein